MQILYAKMPRTLVKDSKEDSKGGWGPRGKETAVWQNAKATLSSVNFISSTPTTFALGFWAVQPPLKIEN